MKIACAQIPTQRIPREIAKRMSKRLEGQTAITMQRDAPMIKGRKRDQFLKLAAGYAFNGGGTVKQHQISLSSI